jgi:UDP-N-acetylmuramoyl-tripeptide--D-alanyl-D-alanine ligase
MRWTLQNIATVSDGNIIGDDCSGNGAAFDSRLVEQGQLFVSVPSSADDAQQTAWINDAIANGATAALTQRDHNAASLAPSLGVPTIVVDDVERALGLVANGIRQTLDIPVVGITGSVGKTSTKDFCAAALSAKLRTHVNTANFNNEIGMPTTILNAPQDVEAMVLEMGMRGFGQITSLCNIAQPTHAIVTRVAPVHTELVGDIAGVARAKGELVESLSPTGIAILNADDDNVIAMSGRTMARTVSYGYAGEVRLVSVVLNDAGYPTVVVESPWGNVTYRLGVMGEHQAHNSVAALATAMVLGIDPSDAADALSRATLSKWRMQRVTNANGAVIINDAYNASPASVQAALRTLAAIDATRRVAVLGRMAELGANETAYHLEVASLAAQLGIQLVAVETPLYQQEPVTKDQARSLLTALGARDAALVKASRSAGLDQLV